jgi:hypothetical protein
MAADVIIASGKTEREPFYVLVIQSSLTKN